MLAGETRQHDVASTLVDGTVEDETVSNFGNLIRLIYEHEHQRFWW